MLVIFNLWGFLCVGVVLIFSHAHCSAENLATNCEKDKYNDPLFGLFTFPATPATFEGTEITIPCPYGFKDTGLQPIPFLTDAASEAGLIPIQSGVTRTCVLQIIDGSLVAQWKPEQLNNSHIKYCREVQIDASIREAKQYMQDPDIPEITEYNYKQLLPKIYALAFYASHDFAAAQTMVEGIGRILSSRKLFETGTAQDDTLFGLLEDFSKAVYLVPGYQITIESSYISFRTVQFPYDRTSTTVPINYTTTLDNVNLKFPSEVIIQGLNQDLMTPKILVMAYSEKLMFHWKENTKDDENQHATTMAASTLATSTTPFYDETTNSTSVLGHWRVLSVELLDGVVENLNAKFEYAFESPDYEELQKNNWTCVFWNETENAWSTEGVETIAASNTITCRATHFTAFSLLIDPLPLPVPGSDYAPIQNSVHSNILSIISSVGSAVSVVGLLGVIFTYGLFRSLRRERSNRILLSLSISLLFMHIVSISSGKELWDGHCLVPALLWIPLIIVSICVGIRKDLYTTGRYDTCIIAAHLDLPLYYAGYLSPVVLILAINFVVFCRIFKVLYNQSSKQKMLREQTRKPKGPHEASSKDGDTLKRKYVLLSPTQIKGAFTVMLLVGVGWIVGLFAIGPFEVFFKYLFLVFNAGSGSLIFLFRVVLHPQARREWRKALFGINLDSSEISTTSSTNINVPTKKVKASSSSPPQYISASNSVENSLTPSNPDATALAKTLASMLEQNNGHNIRNHKY